MKEFLKGIPREPLASGKHLKEIPADTPAEAHEKLRRRTLVESTWNNCQKARKEHRKYLRRTTVSESNLMRNYWRIPGIKTPVNLPKKNLDKFKE